MEDPKALAAAALRSRKASGLKNMLHDRILAALAKGEPPSDKYDSSDFEAVEDDDCFGEAVGVEFIDELRLDKLRTTKAGRSALDAIAACEEIDEDEAHWNGPHGELLDAIVHDACPPRIDVMRSINPFNPVALLTPPSEHALCAVAAVSIKAGEPIALYLGDLTLEDKKSSSNTYVYEWSLDEMRARGYKGSARLRVDASKCGGEARFVNDKWAPPGLPQREPNCYIELIFDGEAKQFHLVFFASKRIRKGQEIIADYGPDYWARAGEVLLECHRSYCEAREKETSSKPKGKAPAAASSSKKRKR